MWGQDIWCLWWVQSLPYVLPVWTRNGLHEVRFYHNTTLTSQIAKFMGPTWGPPGPCRPQMGPMLAPWNLLSGLKSHFKMYTKWTALCPLGSFYEVSIVSWQFDLCVSFIWARRNMCNTAWFHHDKAAHIKSPINHWSLKNLDEHLDKLFSNSF